MCPDINEAHHDIFFEFYRDKCLVYAPLRNVAAWVNRTAGEMLQQSLGNALPGVLPVALEPLREQLAQTPRKPPAPPEGTFAPRQVSFLPTNGCNMRCLYCAPAAGDRDTGVMPLEVCEAGLRYQAEVVQRFNYGSLTVSLFGGEPFCAWDQVRYIVETGKRLADELARPFIITADTNAFMSPTKAHWAAQNMNYLVVSLDGPRSIHDLNRPSATGSGTYDAVARTLDIFAAEGLGYTLRCTVSAGMVDLLPEIAGHFCQRFRPRNMNFEPLMRTGRCLESDLKTPGIPQYVNAVVAAGKVAREHGVGLKFGMVRPERLDCSSCLVACDHLVLAPDGLAAACYAADHRESEYAPLFSLGAYDFETRTLRIDQKRVELMRSYAVHDIPRCQGCFCQWHCAGGCRIHHSPPYCTDAPGAMCAATRRLTLWRILQDMGLSAEADQIRLEEEETNALAA